MDHSYGMQMQGSGAAIGRNIAADEYAQKAIAYAAAQQQAQYIPDSPQKPRESEVTFSQIADQLQRLGAQLERLRGVTNRAVGPRPEPVQGTPTSGAAGIPAALSGRLNAILDALNVANQRLGDDLNRLDSFV